MDVIDLGPAGGDDPSGEGDHLDSAERRTSHWLRGLLRADVLALSGVGLLVLTALGLTQISAALVPYLFSVGSLSAAWVYLPRFVAAVGAVLLGLVGLRQAAAQDSPSWVRMLAGAATVVGLALAIGTAALWLYADEAGLYESPPLF